jgi:hypothetical protein
MVGAVGGRAGAGSITINLNGLVVDKKGTAEQIVELLQDLGLTRGRPVVINP